jgi:hypothetical protein
MTNRNARLGSEENCEAEIDVSRFNPSDLQQDELKN